jgi:hypothetical protein
MVLFSPFRHRVSRGAECISAAGRRGGCCAVFRSVRIVSALQNGAGKEGSLAFLMYEVGHMMHVGASRLFLQKPDGFLEALNVGTEQGDGATLFACFRQSGVRIGNI